MPKKTTINVWPNPFHAVDHEGVPCSLFPMEPHGDGVVTFDDRRFVGATIEAKILQKFHKGDPRQTTQRTSVKYSEEVSTVPNTSYYRNAVLSGELFAADEASAKACGITTHFLEAVEGLQLEKDRAIALWKIQSHEEHREDENDDSVPEVMTEFVFGPLKPPPSEEVSGSDLPKGGA